METEQNLDQMISELSGERPIMKDRAAEIIQNFELGRIQKYLDICALMNDQKRQGKLKSKGFNKGYYKLSQASAEEFGEPLPWLELEKKLDLSHQYNQQLESLRFAGLIGNLHKNFRQEIVDVTGEERPVPTLAEIVQGITKKEGELLLHKVNQGFVKLLVVPFGLPIEELIEGYKKTVVEKATTGKMYDANGNKLGVSVSDPIVFTNPAVIGSDEGENEKMIYYKKTYKGFRTGTTKSQLLKEGHAFEAKLVEDLPQLPTDAKAKVVGDRLQIASGRRLSSVLDILRNVKHTGEELFNFEDWLIYDITKLHQENIQIDSFAWGDPEAVMCCNAGSELYDGLVRSYFYTTSNQAVADLSRDSSAHAEVGTRVSVPLKI